MAPQLPGLLTSSIPAMVMPRNTSSAMSRPDEGTVDMGVVYMAALRALPAYVCARVVCGVCRVIDVVLRPNAGERSVNRPPPLAYPPAEDENMPRKLITF